VNLDEARARIHEHTDLNAFISISQETGEGPAVGVKDLVDVKGMVTTAGSIILPRVAAENDAPVIRRIREAGCGVVGKTNMHEFAFGVTNVNPHFGNALNPYDHDRVSGGSSGGSAVAVAAGMCDWAIGSDTGGSIRIPSSLCGVVGFKPAFGSIDVTGVVPLSHSLDTLGPMATDVSTAAQTYSWMSGEEIGVQRPAAPRLGVPAGWIDRLDEQTGRAWALVSASLQQVEFPEREQLHQTGLSILLYEAAAYHRKWAAEVPEKYGADVLRLIRLGEAVAESDYEAALRRRSVLEEAAKHAMRDIDALVLPATAIVAPLVDAGFEAREPLSRFTRPFNTTYQPVAVVPVPGRDLPVGIQVVGHTNEGTLRAARWLEREWKNLAA
jgi:Asp-tRNA(Asn)/Glu-tRNA(Gln) amidotransferase A subunit family amidase